jgi:pyruvate kinase
VRKVARGRAGVLAKIEKPQAVERLAAIIEHADALMVARGDLGVEMPLERVPGIQKQITRAARRAGKPVVVATQMLESMITAPSPTRAEVSDVATAVFEGADAIMLSAESASGAYPVEAVTTMDRIASEVERDPNYIQIMRARRTDPEATGADAISAAARQIAETLNLAAICSYTASGTTAMRAARERPVTPILALSPVAGTARRLSLFWGLHCVVGAEPDDLDGMVDRACEVAFREGFAKPGERIIITAGVPLGTPGATNMLRIAYVDEDGRGA